MNGQFQKGQLPWNKGMKYDLELRSRLDLSGLEKGRAWNKGQVFPQFSGQNSHRYGTKMSPELKQKLINSHLGKPSPLRGRTRYDMRGSKNPLWKGGITEIIRALRESAPYRNWRRQVFERDNFTCQVCGSKKNLNADHLMPFSLFERVRFDLLNGKTLCEDCHKKTDTFGLKLLRFNRRLQQ